VHAPTAGDKTQGDWEAVAAKATISEVFILNAHHVPSDIIVDMVVTPNSGVPWLTPDQLTRLGVHLLPDPEIAPSTATIAAH
jgi:hypothetical protein